MHNQKKPFRPKCTNAQPKKAVFVTLKKGTNAQMHTGAFFISLVGGTNAQMHQVMAPPVPSPKTLKKTKIVCKMSIFLDLKIPKKLL